MDLELRKLYLVYKYLFNDAETPTKKIYLCFNDFDKAFDNVKQEIL